MNLKSVGQIIICTVVSRAVIPASVLSEPAAAPRASVAYADLLPMEKGAQWTYEGKVEWTVSNSGTVKTAKILWRTEVVDIFEGLGRRAAIVRGFPDELAWYELGQSPGFCVLLKADKKVYRLRADGESQARVLAQKMMANHPLPLEGGEEFLRLPLAVGRKWGQDLTRPDTWYCWCVEAKYCSRRRVPGIDFKGPRTVYQLAYRTCPDHQLLDLTAGLGVVRYVYNHHGTVASADVHLVSFRSAALTELNGSHK